MIRGLRRNPPGAAPAPVQPVDPNGVFDAGVRLERRDDLPAAEEAFGAADRLGHAGAAVKLGVLLEERDDLAGAEQAFRRADDRGDATGAFHLAWLLQERGDLTGAEEAYRRAELRGHRAAGANLRVLLTKRAALPTPPLARGRPSSAPSPPTRTPEAPPPAATPAAPAAGATNGEPETAIHSTPATAAGAGAAAPRPHGQRGLLRRTASVVLPVAAFAVAFLIGDATKRPAPSQPHPAPAANVSHSTVTLSRVAPVPRPAKLVVKPPKAAKPPATATTAATLGATSLHRVTPAPSVYRVSVPRRGPPATATRPASGTMASPSSRTTTATTPSDNTPSGGRAVDGTNGGGTSVGSAGSTTTSTTTTVPGG
ncbi:MAG TPA: hypothetical protein VG325_13865 [Solirubrobacteraceae bacterium]|nr:hypothetical protein [Solirubrobacteraceae bacterium]